MASPAMQPSRSGGLIDPHRQAEYPVLLGKSLQESSSTKTDFVNLRYNWKPRHHSAQQKTVLTKAASNADGNNQYRMTIRGPDADDKAFRYSGYLQQTSAQTGPGSSSPTEQATELALIFDRQKSAFILEKITAALDFNLTSAQGQSSAEVKAHPQLHSKSKVEASKSDHQGAAPANSIDDQEPDTDNPYDFRHFLEEAKAAAAEKNIGNRTPIPGGVSGTASPVPGPSRYRAGSGPGTPLARPNATSTPLKKRKIPENDHTTFKSRPSSTVHKKAPATKPKPSTSLTKSLPLSKERISDSDDEDTITLSKSSSSAARSKPKPKDISNPHIQVVDEAADLVIDMGSPPSQYPRRNRPQHLGASPFARTRPQPTREIAHESEPEQEDIDIDIEMAEAEASSDADVEDLVLGSPREATAPSISVSRVDDEDDDELAAELEAALENEDEDEDDGVGLGISTGQGNLAAEEESEVSEEE